MKLSLPMRFARSRTGVPASFMHLTLRRPTRTRGRRAQSPSLARRVAAQGRCLACIAALTLALGCGSARGPTAAPNGAGPHENAGTAPGAQPDTALSSAAPAARMPPPLPVRDTNVLPSGAAKPGTSHGVELAPSNSEGAGPSNSEGAGPAAAARPVPSKGLCAMGVGIGAALDYEQDISFADAIKVARAMEPAEGVKSDEHGWLRGDGAILVWAGSSLNRGTYKLEYDGKAEVSIELAQGKLSDASYDAALDKSSRELKLATDQDTLKLSFHKTSQGVRNVKLMRPLHHGASSAHGTDEVWYRPMKRIHERFRWIRTMDFTATNGQNVVEWRDRTRPGRFTQQNMVEGAWWQGRGAAWEYAVHMANEEQKDLWISVPLLANDDYVKKLALLLRYGSDGTNPYSSAQAKPTWAPLDPKLKLYVEYSNEIWNFGFPQWTQLLELTKAEVSKGGSNLNFDGSTSDGDWNTRNWARRLVQISAAFREVFGDAAMMTRVRPLFSTQLGWADNYLWQGLWFIDTWFNNGDGVNHVAAPHPVNYYVWGAGGSTYPVGFPEPLEASKSLTVAQIFQGYRKMLAPWSENQKRDIDYARAFGLERISYEGGPGLDNKGGDEFKRANVAKFASQRDPRIKQVYLDMLKRYAELGGDGFTNFLTANPTHGVVSAYDSANLNSPKAQALDKALASPRPAATWGVALPANIWAGRYRVSHDQSSGTRDEPVQFDARTWLSYTVRSTREQTYAVRVSASNSEGEAQLAVWVDGNRAATLRIPNSGAPTTYADSSAVDVTLAPGQHGIRLDGVSGKFAVKQLMVQPAKPTAKQ